ncbi:MAG: DGQHR domain-containing protein [Bacteroidota bacterium]
MMPKQSEIEIPLLKCLDEMGGRGRPRDIHPRITSFFPNLTQSDLAQTLPSGANKWKNSIAWVRQKLISNGEVETPKRGVWAITEKGRNRLASPEQAATSRKRRAGTPSQTVGNVERLHPITSRTVKSEARSRLRPTEDEDINFENSVWTVLHSLTPNAITVGRDPEVCLPSQVVRPDAVAFLDESVALVVECKNTTYDAFVSDWISHFRSVKRELEQSLRIKGYHQFVYVLAVKDKASLKNHTRKDAEQLRVKLIDQREIDYFCTLQKAVGIGVRHQFWATVAPRLVRQREEKLPALRIKRGKHREVYIFSVNADDLLSRSFVSHRQLHSPEEGQVGFQRMLQKKKLGEIVKYIERFKVFPTPIVVVFQKTKPPIFEPLPLKQRAVESMREQIEFGHIRLPNDKNSIQIIDGQHRLYGYSRLARSDEHVVHVIGYKSLKDLSPAAMFVDINSKQTKVPSSLLWELYPDIYGLGEPDYFKAVISRVTETVAKKRLTGFVQHISSGMKGDISFHTLCAEVRRTHLLEKKGGVLQTEQELQGILDAFFIALGQLGQQYPDVNRSFVFTNNGITPMIRTMGRIVQYEIGHNRKDNLRRKHLLIETFRNFFEPVYKYYASLGAAKLSALPRQRVGNAGSNRTEDEITEKIRASYKADFPYRPKKIPPDWEDAIDEFAGSVVNINRQAVESGKARDWVFRQFDPGIFRKQLGKPIDNVDNFGTVLKILYQEVIEGSGKDSPENRLAGLLKVPRIYDVESIDALNILRTCWTHKPEQLDPNKRRKAVQLLAQLSGRPSLAGPSELDTTDYQKMAIAVVRRLIEQALKPALEALRVS